jgi:hypothetical protein
VIGDPGLAFLARRKLRGSLRRQLRRLRTPSGLVFALVGGLLTVGWLGSLIASRVAYSRHLGRGEEVSEHALELAQLGITVLALFSVLTATSLVGVYFPRQEVERLLSAPVRRSSLVRMRMTTDLLRSSFGALVLALLTFQRMPVPAFGLVGAMVAFLSLGILRQLVSLLLAGAHGGLLRWLRGRGMVVLRVAAVLLLGGVAWVAVMNSIFDGRFTRWIDLGALPELGPELLEAGWVRALLAPSYPYARLMTAATAGEFALWLGACLALTAALFELTARLPVDFREHSLETSERIAARISQVRRGGLFSGGEVDARARRRRPPFLLGRGPAGAVAWIKLVGIARKAGGTLLVGALIVTLVAVGVTVVLDDRDVLGTALLAGLGTTYLGGALRFDFRPELDRMVWIKAWPVDPTRTFVAMLAPQVLLTTLLVAVAAWIRLSVLGSREPVAWLLPLGLPPLAFAWLAVDNVVFLFAPFRPVPGQEGSLHNTGRAILTLLVRLSLMFAVLGSAVGVGALLVSFGPELLGLEERSAVAIGVAVGALALLAVDLGLARLGGALLRRFDVARDAV